MDFDLGRLGAREFEHLTQDLALAVIGSGVSVFGDGPDGGREATFNGKITFPDLDVTYPDPDPAGPWNGYGVVQAKYRQRTLGTGPDTDWFFSQVTHELDLWCDPQSARRRFGSVPEYLLLTTNVVLSPMAGTGGSDKVIELMKEYAPKLGLRGWKVWHYDHICRLLELHPAIRRAFRGFTVPGDVLGRLEEILEASQARELGPELTAHAAKSLRGARWVNLGQAGGSDSDNLELSRIAVDLPAYATVEGVTVPARNSSEGAHPERFQGLLKARAAAYVVEEADAVLRPSRLAASGEVDSPWPHLTIIGGPGQGKSTVGQLIAQIYRVALLADRPPLSLGPDATTLLPRIADDLATASMPVPHVRRWPLQISLTEYADAIAGGENKSLLRFIAEDVSQRTSEPVTGSQMRSWLAEWPWLLILDGLDEVATVAIRDRLIERISEFLTDAAAPGIDADLLVVATTRPQGYGGELTPLGFSEITLIELEADEAIHYAGRVLAARHPDDEDHAAQVLSRMTDAAHVDTTARLMRTPLQLTIMSLILERRLRAPETRHALFDAYYQTIYDREANKPGSLAKLLDERRDDMAFLHEQVGRILHVRAETTGEADAQMPAEELFELIRGRIVDDGYDSDEAQRIAASVVKAATDRLVLLVPRATGHVGFEVRSLQEFMAARSIVNGPDQQVLDSLTATAPSAHWRNVWLLAAGRLFKERDHLRHALVNLLREIDTEDEVSLVAAVGSRLGIDLIEDDLALRLPKLERLLAEHAAEVIDLPPAIDLARIARVLHAVASRNPAARTLIEAKLELALASSGPAFLSALLVLAIWADEATPAGTSAQQRLARLRGGLTGAQRVAAAALADSFNRPPGLRSFGWSPAGQQPNTTTSTLQRALAELKPDHGLSTYAALTQMAQYPVTVKHAKADAVIILKPGSGTPAPTIAPAELAELIVALPAEAWPVTLALTVSLMTQIQHRPMPGLIGAEPPPN